MINNGKTQQLIPVDFRTKAPRNINQSKHETEAIWRMCSNVIRMIKKLKLSKCQQNVSRNKCVIN